MSPKMKMLVRAVILFFFGVFFSLVLNLLQVYREQHDEDRQPGKFDHYESSWWVLPACGMTAGVSAYDSQQQKAWSFSTFMLFQPGSLLVAKIYIFAFVGLLYPFLDKRLEEPFIYNGEWSNVMRCVAVFVGINHASAKLEFSNNLHMSLTLAGMCIGLWWLFDRSKSGFVLGVSTAVLATVLTQFLVYQGIYKYSKADFMFVRSWLPSTFFSGGVTIGNIGRQLAMYDVDKEKKD